MSAESEAIEAAVTAKLAELGVEYEARYVGETVEKVKSTEGKDWPHDLWRVTLRNRAGKEVSEEFRTGLGHRKVRKGVIYPTPRYKPGTLADEAWQKANMVPQKPIAATVLHSLCSDGQAAHESFHDWASDLGFDSDSISALNTYNECCRIGREMRALFGKELNVICEMVSQY